MSSMMENVYNGISWFSNRGGGGDSMQPSTGCIKMNYGNESARIPFVGNGSNLVTPPPPPVSATNRLPRSIARMGMARHSR